MVDPTPNGGQSSQGSKLLFLGCFVALITTSFAFTSRITLCESRFRTDFGINNVQVGELIGAGIWPFGISIILFSLVIDKIGYRIAMLFSFVCYAIYLVLACLAYATIQGVTGDASRRHKPRGITICFGEALSWPWATARWKLSSIPWLPRCSKKQKPNG